MKEKRTIITDQTVTRKPQDQNQSQPMKLPQKFHPPDLKWQLSNPMVVLDFVKSDVYDIEILKWFDGSPNYNNYDKLVIHPIEKGNCIEFRNNQGNNYTGYMIELKNLISLNMLYD